MIKEIEVGGVKHSITLSDDMVGKGLVKDSSGEIMVGVFEAHSYDSQYMPGIAFSGSKLALLRDPIARALSGDCLLSEYGRLNINRTGLVHDSTFMSGLKSGLASGLAGSGLSADDNRLSINGWELAGSGLMFYQGKFLVNPQTYGGLISDSKGFRVYLKERTSGLRLLINEYGELDVTQD